MVRADAASARDGARGGLDTLAEMAHLAWLLTVATLAGTTTGCALSIAGGADRNTQPDGAAVGWHLGLSAGFTFDPRQKGALAVAASRRADHPGTSIESYRTDGYEVRGDLDLPWPAWRLTGAGRVATGEHV